MEAARNARRKTEALDPRLRGDDAARLRGTTKEPRLGGGGLPYSDAVGCESSEAGQSRM